MTTRPPPMSITATVIMNDGSRIRLLMLCASRRVADTTIDALYPDARAAFITVKRNRSSAC